MILVGSAAAMVQGVRVRRRPTDLDLLGTTEELDEFRGVNANFITSEERKTPTRVHFSVRSCGTVEKVEFDTNEFPSTLTLRELCTYRSVPVMSSRAFIPSC